MADHLTTGQIKSIFFKNRDKLTEDNVLDAVGTVLVKMSERLDDQDRILMLTAQEVGKLKGVAEPQVAPPIAPGTPDVDEEAADENDPTPTDRPPVKVSVAATPQPAASAAPPPPAQPQQVVTPIKANQAK